MEPTGALRRSPAVDLMPPTIVDYRSALLKRFANPRVRDQLSRVAADGSVKMPVRIVPVLRAERADGRMPVGCATAIAAWTLHLRGRGAPIKDPGADRARTAAGANEEPLAGVQSRFGAFGSVTVTAASVVLPSLVATIV